MNLLAAHLFAHVAKLDEGHAGAPDLEDWDWLRVDEDLAELGVVTLTTARAPTPRLDVTWREDTSAAWFRWEGGRGLHSTQMGSIVINKLRSRAGARGRYPWPVRFAYDA